MTYTISIAGGDFYIASRKKGADRTVDIAAISQHRQGVYSSTWGTGYSERRNEAGRFEKNRTVARL